MQVTSMKKSLFGFGYSDYKFTNGGKSSDGTVWNLQGNDKNMLVGSKPTTNGKFGGSDFIATIDKNTGDITLEGENISNVSGLDLNISATNSNGQTETKQITVGDTDSEMAPRALASTSHAETPVYTQYTPGNGYENSDDLYPNSPDCTKEETVQGTMTEGTGFQNSDDCTKTVGETVQGTMTLGVGYKTMEQNIDENIDLSNIDLISKSKSSNINVSSIGSNELSQNILDNSEHTVDNILPKSETSSDISASSAQTSTAPISEAVDTSNSSYDYFASTYYAFPEMM